VTQDLACAAPPDRRWWITKKASATWKEVRWQTYLNVYCRFIYWPHMRLLHRHGRHWFTHLRPMGGPEQEWCQWCGERRMLGEPDVVTCQACRREIDFRKMADCHPYGTPGCAFELRGGNGTRGMPNRQFHSVSPARACSSTTPEGDHV
jgi:hypothetical protein